jgi:1-acyl-sn-glycerol-3-phosphate acyltransferase
MASDRSLPELRRRILLSAVANVWRVRRRVGVDILPYMTNDADTNLSRPLPSPTRRNWLWYSLQMLAHLAFCLWFRLRSRGAEKLPARGGALLLINHQSFLDPLVVGEQLTRPVSYVARDSLFRVPVVGWILRNTYVFPISREAASSSTIKDAVRRMQHGFFVGIFPEGTRSIDGTLGEMKPGFLALVRRGGVPVYPVGISGSGRAFPRDTWIVRPRTIRVVFGEPFTDVEIRELTKRGRENEFIALVRERIDRCRLEAEDWIAQGGRAN